MKKIIYFIIVITALGIFGALVLWGAGTVKTLAEGLGFIGAFFVSALLIRGIMYLLTRE